MENKIKTVLFKLIDYHLIGVDIYSHGNILWFIFTERKEWVFRLDKEGNLVYSYYFFKKIFQWLSMDVIEKQEYITEYIENAIQNGIRNTEHSPRYFHKQIENALQNGIKKTRSSDCIRPAIVEETIQNGVKNIRYSVVRGIKGLEETLQSGTNIKK